MNNIYYLFFAGTLFGLEVIYFRVARYYKILDHPNDRSLHERPTIRGGGIIFYLAAALFFTITYRPSILFMTSLSLLSIIGFIDDVRSLSTSVRFIVQLIAFTLVFVDLEMTGFNYFSLLIILIVSVGALNTFNFMDGINGLTGGYGFITLGSLLYINAYKTHFIESDFIEAIIMAVLIFCFFNFRKKAVCFAGDVGSYAIGFISIYLIIKLIAITDNYVFVFLLSVYGVDSVLTIIHRLIRKENIFKPHKLHLFQVLVNNSQISHIQMSSVYLIVQLAINSILIALLNLKIGNQFIIGTSIVVALGITYVLIKSRILKTELD